MASCIARDAATGFAFAAAIVDASGTAAISVATITCRCSGSRRTIC
ncbi:hypothetical protein L0Z22_19875 [Burkholderia cepacia]|nr:hypothetical protein [Burkholderia cepacia]UQO37926.1 hypothetical protein L0Z22_19875 [Burkholderia cepacia]UQP06411.1 hypothetical protein L0Z01_02840 [Burkholderia cepacia]